jgi:glycosyltransferase involved in cell wall biosynthesis
MKVMLGMPCYSSKVHIQTMRSILGDTIQLLARKDQVLLGEDVGNSDIAGSRAAIVATFYRSDADVLVFVDDDIYWTPGDIVKLVDHPVDLVGGIYPKKFDKLDWPIRTAYEDKLPRDENTGLYEIAGLPGGFMKITRACIEKMIEAYPKKTHRSNNNESTEFWPLFDPYELSNGNRLSEDFAFCQRWRDIGGTVWADFSFKMGHIGYKSFEGCLQDYLNSAENNVK